ncbi:MAG: hypothetical protein IJW29_01985 [Clostridia bacterium]|nr:hypothetical protein [Clostridia bacterium]
MKQLTLAEHRARIENIRFADTRVRKCLRREHVRNYIPGQVIYNLGEYPAKFSIRPTEYDYNLIKSLSERGVGLIQLHEEWNDSQRLLGADKFTSHDPEGLREFIKLCHDFGIKVLPYVSSGFFDWRDPDFTERFSTRGVHELNGFYFRYRCCDSASPEWNAYLLPRIEKILDDYEFDGIYNDMGYACDNHPAFGYLDYDPYFEDLLARIYTMVKSRGGIVKMHQGYCVAPRTHERVYDYLWVGECMKHASDLLATAQFDPYVIVNPDFRFLEDAREEALYAMALPLMQFLLRVDGRPVTGERAFVPGVDYINNPDNNELLHYQKMRRWHEEHPDGPHCYSSWSAIPDDPVMREKWFDYLALYKPMVEENTAAYIDITDGTLTQNALPDGVHASLFVNRECYLCISNVGKDTQAVTLTDTWLDRQTGERVRTLTLPHGTVRFLKLIHT